MPLAFPPAHAQSVWTGEMEGGWKYIRGSDYGQHNVEEHTYSVTLTFNVAQDGTFTGQGNGWDQYTDTTSFGCNAFGRADVSFTFSGYQGYMERLVFREFDVTPKQYFASYQGCSTDRDPKQVNTGRYVDKVSNIELRDGAVFENGNRGTYDDSSDGIRYYDMLVIHGSALPPSTFDYEISAQPQAVDIMLGQPIRFDLVATLLGGAPKSVDLDLYLFDDEDNFAHLENYDTQVTPTGTIKYEVPTGCDGTPGTYGIVVYGSVTGQEPKTASLVVNLRDNPNCEAITSSECPEFTITPTLPPQSDPRMLAKPSDGISYRLRVDWAGHVPASIDFSTAGGDGQTIIPQFAFDPANMSTSPTSVLMDVTTRHAATGSYPIVVGAQVFDPASQEWCAATTTVTLVVSEDSRAFALPIVKVDREQGSVVIEKPDQLSPSPEIQPGSKVKTGMEGNVDLSLDEGNKVKVGRETVVAIGEIKPEPDGTVDIVLPPNWVPDNMSYPPVDSEIFWKETGEKLLDGHKRLAPQIAETAIACIGASLTGGLIGGLECGRQALFLLYNGQAYLTHEPMVEPTTTIVPGPGPVLVTPSSVGVPLSTEYSVEVLQDGTTVYTVLEGPVWVMDVKSKQGIFLDSHEQLAIPGTGNGLSEQELKERVIQLAAGSTYAWWTKSVKNQFQIGDVGLSKTWEDEYPYKPTNETSQFSDQDLVVYAWINFANVLPPEHTIDFKWYRPDGVLYRSETKTIDSPEAQYSGWSYYPLWSQLDISNASVTDRPGQWKVSILADGTLVKEIPFSIIKSADGGGGCLIATAAFGSELTPQVQFLRNFRDNNILSTAAGSSFMNVFNSWYYSFSPHVANYEREQPWLQSTVKALIYPLLGILTMSEKAYASIPGEYGAVTAGVVASSMMGAVYFWPAAFVVQRFSRRSRVLSYGSAAALTGAALAAVAVSMLAASPVALMASTSFLVLTVVAVSALLSARLVRYAISRFVKKINRHGSKF